MPPSSSPPPPKDFFVLWTCFKCRRSLPWDWLWLRRCLDCGMRSTEVWGHTPSIAFRHPHPKEGCRKPVLGVWSGARQVRSESCRGSCVPWTQGTEICWQTQRIPSLQRCVSMAMAERARVTPVLWVRPSIESARFWASGPPLALHWIMLS